MENRLKEILEKIRPGITEEESNDFIEDGLLESLDVMNLIAALEEEFDIEFEPEDITPDNFSAIRSISLIVKKYVEQ